MLNKKYLAFTKSIILRFSWYKFHSKKFAIVFQGCYYSLSTEKRQRYTCVSVCVSWLFLITKSFVFWGLMASFRMQVGAKFRTMNHAFSFIEKSHRTFCGFFNFNHFNHVRSHSITDLRWILHSHCFMRRVLAKIFFSMSLKTASRVTFLCSMSMRRLGLSA